jgi:hypothetical protein
MRDCTSGQFADKDTGDLPDNKRDADGKITGITSANVRNPHLKQYTDVRNNIMSDS